MARRGFIEDTKGEDSLFLEWKRAFEDNRLLFILVVLAFLVCVGWGVSHYHFLSMVVDG